jgi:hypothetical protein
LFGHTFLFKAKREKKYKPYLDAYIGTGIRYQEETFETFNGYIGETFFTYNKDRFYHILPSPQFGVKLGLMK